MRTVGGPEGESRLLMRRVRSNSTVVGGTAGFTLILGLASESTLIWGSVKLGILFWGAP